LKKALANCSPSRRVDSIILKFRTLERKSAGWGPYGVVVVTEPWRRWQVKRAAGSEAEEASRRREHFSQLSRTSSD
jgi:hypothetical protein